MKRNKGFTIVELLIVIVIVTALAVFAGIGVFTILHNQKQRLAYTAEQNVHDASLTFYSKEETTYLPSCKNSSDANIVISQKNVEDVNTFLKEKFQDIASENDYQLFKNYTINSNSDPANKYELDSFINVSNRSCYKLVTVGELIENGLLSDDNEMCDKSSVIIVYKKGNAKNASGILESIQEPGVCKSDRTSDSGPVITINPPSNLNMSFSKRIKIIVNTESTKLKQNFTMQYGWSKDKRKKPTSYSELQFLNNSDKNASAEIIVETVDETRYLWIKAGTELDNKNNKTSDMIAGPYAFLPTVQVSYDVNTGDEDSCPAKKIVVYTKTYGKNQNNAQEDLCTPTKLGYDFTSWYKDGSIIIENSTRVDQKTDHTIVANWEKHVYNITYDLAGGVLEPGKTNPSSYDIESDAFTLNNPTRAEYGFIGWTGPGLSEPTKNVTVSKGSTGDRKYTANWVKIPTCSLSATPGPNEYGWNNKDVKITMTTTSSPTEYGLAQTQGSTNKETTYTLDTETPATGITIYGYVKNAGGENSCNKTIKIDKTPREAPYINTELRLSSGLYINKYGNCHPMYPSCWTDSLDYNQANGIVSQDVSCSSETSTHSKNCVVIKNSAIGGFQPSYPNDTLSGNLDSESKRIGYNDKYCNCNQRISFCPILAKHTYVSTDKANNKSYLTVYQITTMCNEYVDQGKEKELFKKHKDEIINADRLVINTDKSVTIKHCPPGCYWIGG